jgi:hypothetical protein
MKAPFLWARIAAGCLPHSGPRSRSSSMCQAGKEASATLLLDSAAQGPRLPPLQLQHGRRTLQPRQGFPRRQRCRGWKPTTPLSGIVLTTKVD